MGGSQDCVLPAPQVASAGPLTAVRGLPALGVWGGGLLDTQPESLRWKFLSPGMGFSLGAGREQRIITGQTHSPVQRQHLAPNEAPLRLRRTLKIAGVTPGCSPPPRRFRCGPLLNSTSLTWGLVINAESGAPPPNLPSQSLHFIKDAQGTELGFHFLSWQLGALECSRDPKDWQDHAQHPFSSRA